MKQVYNHCKRYLVGDDTSTRKLEVPHNHRLKLLIKKAILMLLLESVKCPYNHLTRLSHKKHRFATFTGKCDFPCNQSMRSFLRKPQIDTFTLKSEVLLKFAA